MSDKYKVMVSISYSPANHEDCHKRFKAGETFIFPDDVLTPDGCDTPFALEWFLSKGCIEKVGSVSPKRKTSVEEVE